MASADDEFGVMDWEKNAGNEGDILDMLDMLHSQGFPWPPSNRYSGCSWFSPGPLRFSRETSGHRRGYATSGRERCGQRQRSSRN